MPPDIEPDDFARYSRQMLLPQFGADGQRRLRDASVTLVGCGALGSTLANTLVRAGVGTLRIIDRDFVTLDNLQRQLLFDEQDCAQGIPKAQAAARRLRRINSSVRVEGVVTDLHAGNVLELLRGSQLILDGTDNLDTRYLINDAAVRDRIPWVFGACVGTAGLVLAIRPHQTPCLRCVWPEPPAPGSVPTCDTVGVLATIVALVSAFQATEALKILLGRESELHNQLLTIDVWRGRVRGVEVQSAYAGGDCPCCQLGRYDFLQARSTPRPVVLCGRNGVQITPATPAPVDLAALAGRLPPHAAVQLSEFMLRFDAESCRVAVFPDGRAIIQGTADVAVARVIYARYIGH
jgi:molybdopterin-synthase adenylyltransferase